MKNNVVFCSMEHIEMENLAGIIINSIKITCPLCHEDQDCLGDDDVAIRKCLMSLKEFCGCDNYLIVGEKKNENNA